MKAHWLADRAALRALWRLHPTWPMRDVAAALGRSLGWVKKWLTRLRGAPPDDDTVVHSRSRARLPPPARLSPVVIERSVEIRDHPPETLRRTPGPVAILSDMDQEGGLRERGERVPRSTRTIWRVLREQGRILPPDERRHQPAERPAPLSAWQRDCKDVSAVSPEPDGKQQHVGETLHTVDTGTSLL